MLSASDGQVPAAVGVDIGGTHISAAAVDLVSGVLVSSSLRRREVNSNGDAKELIQTWGQIIGEVIEDQQLEKVRIGIAMPGPFDYEEGISQIKDQNKFDALYGLNIKELLARELSIEKKNIRFMNDAACFLSGEVFSGAARHYHRAIGLTLGTGFGTATYLEGMAEDAALWQHPFKDSIAEDYLSTRWFVNRYQEIGGPAVKGVKELLGYTRTDTRAIRVFEEFGRNLALFLAYFIREHAPEVVVMGGNIANAADLFLPVVKTELAARLIRITVTKTLLGENACLIGAASCWRSQAGVDWKEK